MSVRKSSIYRVPDLTDHAANPEELQAQIDRLVGAKDSLKTSIANKGVTVPDSVKMDGLAALVDDIKQLDTSDATAAAKDIMKDKTAYVNGVKVTGTKEIKLQTKTIAPATYDKNAYPDDGYDGLSKVTVSAIPTVLQGTPVITVSEDGLITAKATQNPGYVNSGSKSSTQQLDTQAAKTVTPTTASQTAVAKGVYTTGAVTVAGDANLKAENIANGVKIFGVTGTLDAPYLCWTFNDTIDAASCPETDIDFYCPQLSTVTYNTIKYGTQPLASLNYVSGNNATTCAYIVDSTTWMENAQHIVFTEPPTGALLAWLKANATSDVLDFQNKSVTITENGTTTITPDSPYDALSSVGVTVNVASTGSASEAWVLNETVDVSTKFSYTIDFTSNNTEYTSISVGGSAAPGVGGMVYALRYGSESIIHPEYNGIFLEGIANYRKLIFATAPDEGLLTWLQANGIKQASDTAIQPSKSLTVTENGTMTITPDSPYDALSSVEVSVYASDSFPNGTKWTRSNITSGYFYSVANANGIWAACSGSSKGLYYSADGKTWTQSNITSGHFNSVYNANGIWVAASYSRNGLYYSADGKTWTRSNITSGNFGSSYNANGIWVATGDSSNGLYYSADGKTWTRSNITSVSFSSAYNANGIWVATGDSSNGLYYSADGKTWTQSNITSNNCGSVYNANGIWVAASNNGLYYSADGKTWTQSNITSNNCRSVYNANGIWVAASNNGPYYSADGKTWTQSNITSGTFYSVTNANGIWVAASTNGLYYSADGKTWTQSNITSGTFYSVTNANGIWVAISYSNSGLYYSVSWG